MEIDLELAKPPKQALWPNIVASSRDGEKLAQVSSGHVWIEAGLSHRSLMPFAGSHRLWLLYDRRPWSYAMTTRMHSPDVRAVFLALKQTHLVRRFDTAVLREMARLCSGLKNDEDVGTAMFVLWATGAVTNTAPTIEQAVNCSSPPEELPTIFERHGLMHTMVLPHDIDDEKFVRKIVDDMKAAEIKDYHLNVNWTKAHPAPERIRLIADSLVRRGVSWSFMFIDRTVAKDVVDEYKVAKIGNTFYVVGGPASDANV